VPGRWTGLYDPAKFIESYEAQAGAYQNTLDYPVNLGEGSSCAHGLIRMVMV